MSDLKICLLGAPTVTRADRLVETGRSKATALLAYLVLNDQILRRETIAALFWPEYGSSQGRADLSRILSVLRKRLGDGWLASDRQTVGIEYGANLWLDVGEFRRLLAHVHSHRHEQQRCPECLHTLLRAAELYQGDFMAGFTLADSPEFDDWQALQVESLRQELGDGLDRLARQQALHGDFPAAIKSAQRRLNLDPLQEMAQRQLMRLFAWAGDRSAAMRQYEACRRLLDIELGVPPEAETEALYKAIQAGELPPSLVSAGPVSAGIEGKPGASSRLVAAPSHNLPPTPTPFVGRQEELARLDALIQDETDCRLLTLLGPGGMGKSRLAIEAAGRAARDANAAFPDGVYFVPLAGIGRPDELAPAIAESLKLSFYSGPTPEEQLLAYLGQKRLLLVLDNLEQLLSPTEASPPEELEGTTRLLAAVIGRSPQVKLMVTSRQRLNLQEEWLFELSGLPFPPASEMTETEATAYSAVELFLGRARRARTTFVADGDEIGQVIRICRLVGGSPLGIELAAAWVRLMSCADIAREIERGLDFLSTSLVDIPRRHRSLRTVFEQSWSHLPGEEAAVFRRLSLFQGGFRLRAARRVVGASPNHLSALVDRSLLRRTRSGRYEIHELLRQFAAEKLAENADEERRAREAHASYFASFVGQRRHQLRGHRLRQALAELLEDVDNVRAAWKWAVSEWRSDIIGKSLEALLIFYWMQGWFLEGETAFRQAALALRGRGAAPDGSRSEKKSTRAWKVTLGRALAAQGFFLVRLGRYESALERSAEGISLLRQADAADQDLGYSLLLSSIVEEVNGRYREAKQAIQEYLTLSRRLADRWGTGTALVRLGQVARRQRQFLEAEQHLQDGINLLKQAADQKGMAYALDDLGHVMRALGRYREAQGNFEEALRLRQDIGDREGSLLSLKNSGDMNRLLGQYSLSQERYQESLALAQEMGYSLKIADSLDGLGMVARFQGEYKRAERYHQESLSLYREIGSNRRIALCLINLGRLEYSRGELARAESYLQESLALCRQHGHLRELLACCCYLGYLFLELQAHTPDERAGQYFTQALELATEVRSAPAALEILPGLARLRKRSGETQDALDLLTMVRQHPAADHETRQLAARLLAGYGVETSSADVPPAGDETADLWPLVGDQLDLLKR